jgi:hypothetical protein
MQQIFNYFRIKDQKLINDGGRIGRYHMVIGFKTTYVIAMCTRYNAMSYSFSVTCGRSVLFSGTPVSSTNEADP